MDNFKLNGEGPTDDHENLRSLKIQESRIQNELTRFGLSERTKLSLLQQQVELQRQIRELSEKLGLK